MNDRDRRQASVIRWVHNTFGVETMTPTERVTRFLEEAIELAQAQGVTREEAQAVLAHVFNKPVGMISQEVGGVGVTLLAYCAVVGLSADDEEMREFARVLAVDPEVFRKRHNAKADAGVAVRIVKR